MRRHVALGDGVAHHLGTTTVAVLEGAEFSEWTR